MYFKILNQLYNMWFICLILNFSLRMVLWNLLITCRHVQGLHLKLIQVKSSAQNGAMPQKFRTHSIGCRGVLFWNEVGFVEEFAPKMPKLAR